MGITKGLIFLSFCCLALGDDIHVAPGPIRTSSKSSNTTTLNPPITTTKSTSAPITFTNSSPSPTPKPTSPPTTKASTTSSTTTPKPTPPPTTSKPTPPPTTAKPTTPTPVNPIGKWVVTSTDNKEVCLVLEAALEIDLHYKVDNTTKTFPVPVTSAATAKGVCSNTTESIILTFGLSNNINFNFKKSNDSKKYDLESIIIMLNVTVPGLNGTQLYVLAHDKEEFSTPTSNSYKCAKEQLLNLTSQPSGKDFGGELKISHFQVQAFRSSNSTKFDEALDCQSSETPDVVPIAVGCALAALVIIVLIAYLIGRRRSQARGYLSM